MRDLGAQRSQQVRIANPHPEEAGHPLVSDVRAIRRRLLAWYDRRRRELPWRDLDPPDPYATLVSEAMLQQTQVATVIPYYLRFMDRFQTVDQLAAASIDEVLPYWAGLGYYRRCHNLHAAARQVLNEHGGKFPRDVSTLRSLRGVGRYTAGAIASIAFGVPAPAVDGNVRRIITRVLGLGDGNGSASVVEQVWSVASQWAPRKRPGDFNQALMELGATICKPRQPNCPACPLRRCCSMGGHPSRRAAGFIPAAVDRRKPRGGRAIRRTAHLPRRRAPKALPLVTVAIEHRGRLLYRRRPDIGLWSGLWEWPTEPVEPGTGHWTTARRIVTEHTGSRTVHQALFRELTHELTHRRVHFWAYHVRLHGRLANRIEGRWLRHDSEPDLPMSRAQVKLLTALKTHRGHVLNSER